MMQQWLVAQPVNQFIAIRCIKDCIQRVIIIFQQVAIGSSQQVQIMITEDSNGAVAQAADKADDLQGFGSAIDEITGKPDLVASGLETQLIQ